MFAQGLYWKNIPLYSGGVSNNLDFLKENIVERSFMRHITNPFFIFTGNNNIDFFKNKIYKKEIIEKINNTGLLIYLYEPICWRIGNHNKTFYSEFDDNVDLSLLRSDELDSIAQFIINNNLINVKIFTCDYNIDKIKNNYPLLNLYCLDILLRSIPLYRKIIPEKKIKKKFWCSNWRYTGHRHLITSFLTNFDSTISWNLKCSFNNLRKLEWFDFDKIDPDTFNKIKLGADLLEQTTLNIDCNLDAMSVDDINGFYSQPKNKNNQYDQLMKSLDHCFCGIINETRYAQPFGNISEKVMHAAHTKTPFVLAAPPFSLEYMKKLGFRTFDRWWDESYDQETNHQNRILKIFKVIEYIDSKSIPELEAIYNEMTEILEHNLEIKNSLNQNSLII